MPRGSWMGMALYTVGIDIERDRQTDRHRRAEHQTVQLGFDKHPSRRFM